MSGSKFDLERLVLAQQLRVGAQGISESAVSIGAGADDRTGPATVTFGHVPPTDEERQLLAALCRPVLLDPTAGPDSLAANRELARELDWSASKFNRKLDYLCTRLTKVGVRGLQGGRGSEAVNRRWRLVEHAVSSRMITADDL